MREDRRMTSIARRMNFSWVFRVLRMMVLIDLLMIGMVLFGWCKGTEARAGGVAAQNAEKHLSWNVEIPLMQRPETITYSFISADGTAQTITDAAFFRAVWQYLQVVFGIEIAYLVTQCFLGKRAARKQLKPLEKMAHTAQELSRVQLSPEKLHHLEDMLATASPTNPQVQLKTEDRELQGLEVAINGLLARMQESYREQSRFVSDASHELRTPIAVIQGYADMLSRWGKLDEKVLDEGIGAIQSESEHMKKLVDQLLFLARGDSGRNQLAMAEMDLSDMMQEVFEESKMIHEDRNWQYQAEGRMPMIGDAALLKQTARILTDNAVKYTAIGDKITLRARYKDGVPCFEVQDNGIGIKEEDLNHIFDRFFRADPARTRSTGGTGLGLSIAKWIVDQHGGHFDIFSREEFGTRICVVLPQDVQDESNS